MSPALHTSAILLLFSLFTANPAAAERDTMIWLADDVSLEGTHRITFLPIVDDTKIRHEDDIAQLVSLTIHDELSRHGITVIDKDIASPVTSLSLEVHIVTYIPGSVDSKWANVDGGTAACTLQSYLFSANSKEAIAEVIVGRQVLAGGLFSEHPGLTAARQAAQKTAQTLSNLFAAKP